MALEIKELYQGQQFHLANAVAATAAQIDIAKELVERAFPGGDACQNNPELLAAVIQALAINFATDAAGSNR